MNKGDIIFQIIRELNKRSTTYETRDGFSCIQNYFSELSIEDLIGVASQYGITCSTISDKSDFYEI